MPIVDVCEPVVPVIGVVCVVVSVLLVVDVFGTVVVADVVPVTISTSFHITFVTIFSSILNSPYSSFPNCPSFLLLI